MLVVFKSGHRIVHCVPLLYGWTYTSMRFDLSFEPLSVSFAAMDAENDNSSTNDMCNSN